MVIFFLFFTFYAVLERFNYVEMMAGFPLYHWELGFGRVEKHKYFYHIYLKEINGVKVDPPIRLRDLLKEKGIWQKTSDYKMEHKIGYRDWRDNADPQKQRLLRSFEQETFKKLPNIDSARYYVVKYEFDVLDYYKNKTIKETFESPNVYLYSK